MIATRSIGTLPVVRVMSSTRSNTTERICDEHAPIAKVRPLLESDRCFMATAAAGAHSVALSSKLNST